MVMVLAVAPQLLRGVRGVHVSMCAGTCVYSTVTIRVSVWSTFDLPQRFLWVSGWFYGLPIPCPGPIKTASVIETMLNVLCLVIVSPIWSSG